MSIVPADHILLTGAGFTKNFGGFLGSEMWALVFNHPLISKSPSLKQLLTSNYDYESIYSEVIDSESYSSEDKESIRVAVENAYKALDDAIKGWVFNSDSPFPVNWYGVNKLFSIFNGGGGKQGLFFTLNQDLFMERRSGSLCPGIPRFSHDFYSFNGRDLLQNEFVTLPNEADAERRVLDGIKNHAGPVYIKLHGSYGWRSAQGSNPMVIGTNKTHLIEREPVLKAYFDIFNHALKSGGRKLLIIGYGFRDTHINEVIWDAAKNHDLRLYIISPTPPDKFEAGNFVYDTHRLWDSIVGYYPHSLKEIFPSNQDETVMYNTIKEALLRN